MNILHLHEWSSIKGGAEVYISQLMELLPAYGCTSYWIGLRLSEDGRYQVTEYQQENIQYFDTKQEIFTFLKAFFQAKKIDILNLHNFFIPEISNFCLQNLPTIRTAHGPQLVCPGNDKFWRKSERVCDKVFGLHCLSHIYTEGCANRHPKRVFRAFQHFHFEHTTAIKQYHRIMVMSEYVRQEYIKGGIPAEKILLNPYFTPLISESELQPLVENAPKSLLFMGRLISTKGVHILIESLLPLLTQRTDIQLDIVGDGIMRAEIEGIIAKTGLANRIVLHGWKSKSEIASFLQKAYLVLFPSIYPEAFGLVGIEAMMYAKPVVAFDAGGVSTWLKNEETGFLVPLKDTKALYNAVKKLLEDNNCYQQMAQMARIQAVKYFSAEIHLKQLLAIYQSAIHTK